MPEHALAIPLVVPLSFPMPHSEIKLKPHCDTIDLDDRGEGVTTSLSIPHFGEILHSFW